MASAALSLALHPLRPPKAPPEALGLVDLLALARSLLDQEEAFGETEEARTPSAERDLAALNRVRSARKLLAALRQTSSQAPGLLDEQLSSDLEDLYDRAEELVDTLLWATERRELLLDVIQAETS